MDFLKALLPNSLLNIPKAKKNYLNGFINALFVHGCPNGTDLLLSAPLFQVYCIGITGS